MLTSLLADKLIRLLNKIFRNFMNKYVNPPCKVISHMPRRSLLPKKSNFEREVGSRSPFGGSVASDEPELAIDEGVPEFAIFPLFESNHPRRREVREESVGGDRSKQQSN